jgi:uncharacterized protein (DUF2252 family)
LAQLPRTGLHVQLCGDAHLANFGLFASRERRTLFDVDEFDQTLPGPFEWDVKRLAASVAIAGRAKGLTRWFRRRIVLDCSARYRATMRQLAGRDHLAVWGAPVDVGDAERRLAPLFQRAEQASGDPAAGTSRARTSLPPSERLVTLVDGEPRIRAHPPLIVPSIDLMGPAGHAELTRRMEEILEGCGATLAPEYRRLLRRYSLADVARQVTGVGGVGARAWMLLMLGRDKHDRLLLRVNEAEPSVLDGHAGVPQYGNEGERIVRGQRLIEAEPDLFLGWRRVWYADGRHRDFYIRRLRGLRAAVPEQMDAESMRICAELCAATLARAHARSGDGIAIAAYLGSGEIFDQAIASFAEAYADRNEEDYRSLREAARTGRIVVQTGQ